MKTFSLGQILEAMEKNGYEKASEEYIVRDPVNNEVFAACAIGQAALNLGVEPALLDRAMNHTVIGISGTIVDENDFTDKSVPEIAKWVRLQYADRLDEEIHVLDQREEVASGLLQV